MSTATQHIGWKRRAFSIGAGFALILSAVAGPGWSASAQDFDISVSSVSDLSGLTAIAGGDGDGVNVRSEPGLDSDIVATVPDGTVVDLRVDTVDTVRQDDLRWWPVSVNGTDGWIAGPWLQDSDGAQSSDSSGDSSDSPATDSDTFASGSYVRAATDDGQGVNIRSKPALSAGVLTGIPNGDIVQVMDGPTTDDDGNQWYKVTDGDVTGYASGEWLEIATGPDADGAVAGFEADDWVRVSTDDRGGLNLRADASTSSDVIDGLGENARLLVLDGPELDDNGQPWYEVNHFNETGWVSGTFLESSSEPSYSSQYSSVTPSQPTTDSPPAQVASEPGVATGVLRAPLDNYTVTQEFGCSYLGFYTYNDAYGCPVHDGIDLAAPMYTQIHAADGGTVTAAGWCDCGLGYYVQIDHGNGISTIYGHMAEQPYVSTGQLVAKGDVIGPVGSTGASTGPHTHFMVLVNGTATNPRDYVSF